MLLSDMWQCTHVQGPMFCQTNQQMKAMDVFTYFEFVLIGLSPTIYDMFMILDMCFF